MEIGVGEKQRIDPMAVRRNAMYSIHSAASGHPGGVLSCVDLLAHIVERELHWVACDWPAINSDQNRNRFILSKGHACPALYAAAAEAGLISRRALLGLRKMGSPLQGHPSVRDLPWVETSTGSLGQGLSVATGMALGLRHFGRTARVIAMLGDGELQEGEVWEGAMLAGHYKLDNLVIVVDYNKLQSDDSNENVMGIEPLRAKWEAFRFAAIEIDGHDPEAIRKGFDAARKIKNRPTVIIANTIKGRGVSFMEGSPFWHGSVKLRDDDLRKAVHELNGSDIELEQYFAGQLWRDDER